MWFRPRDIGINRYPLYINGQWQRDCVYDGFEFTDIEDLKAKLAEKYNGWKNDQGLLDLLTIKDNGGEHLTVMAWTAVGWVK